MGSRCACFYDDFVVITVSEVAAEQSHRLGDGAVSVAPLEAVAAAGDGLAACGAQDRDVIYDAGHGVVLLFWGGLAAAPRRLLSVYNNEDEGNEEGHVPD